MEAHTMEICPLEGVWIPHTARLGANELPPQFLASTYLSIVGDRYSVQIGAATDNGILRLNPMSSPNAMDVIGVEGPNRGRIFLAIYALEEDHLTVCYALCGDNRPTQFDTHTDPNLYLISYIREP